MPRRPGTRHILSPAAYVEKQYQKCLELEQRLQQAQQQPQQGSATTATTLNKLRIPLCEVLSDLLLTDPAFATQHGLVERLWRLCFYPRICALRTAVQYHEKKKRQNSNNASTTNNNNKAHKALLDFLSEAIILYDYLVAKLQSKLVQQLRGGEDDTTNNNENTTTNANRSTDSSTLGAYTTTTTSDHDHDSNSSTEGIVDCLTRLSVQMGDLYRYQENYAQAQEYYLRAVYLGPGHGHAMNQLAVVLSSSSSSSTSSSSGSKDAWDAAAGQRAVALYWYVRSLSVVTTPFATARANLVRLWENNRSWLRQQQPKMSGGTATAVTDNNKSAQNRRFMAHFCELHDLFFGGLTISSISQDQVYAKMEACRLEFKSLLQNSALGDSLLCKMVTVCAFSECFLDRSILSKPKQNDNSNYKTALTGPIDPVEVQQTTALMTRTCTLWLGAELVERLLAVSSSSYSGNRKRQASLRLLLPLLLLAEYVYTSPLPERKMPKTADDSAIHVLEQRHEQAVGEFWKLMLDLLNQLKSVAEQQEHLAIDESLLTKEGAVLVAKSLNEYKNLRGFAPFGKFLPQLTENGVLEDEEALQVLETRPLHKTVSRKGTSGGGGSHNNNNSKSQESSSVVSMATAGGGSANQNRMKVARLLWLGGKLAADNKSQVGKRVRYDELDSCYAWDAIDEDGRDDVLMEDATNDVQVMQFDQKESPVVPQSVAVSTPLVYQQAAGGGPALLVPGDLIKVPQKAVTGPPLNPTPMNEIPVMATEKEPHHLAPGTNVPFSPPAELGSAAKNIPTTSVAADVAPKRIMPPPGFGNQQVLAPGIGLRPPEAQAFGAGGLFPQAPYSAAAVPTVAESVDLFGDLQTANPFADAMPPPSSGHPFASLSAVASHISPHDIFSSNDDTMMNGTPLLDSSLLNSLFMDDTSTVSKNPFAA